MSFDLALTPAGRITVAQQAADERDAKETAAETAQDTALHGRAAKVVRAFASSQAEGLFTLAVERFEDSPSSAYWRDVAARWLTELCHLPENAGGRLDPIPPPDGPELDVLLLGVPPMQGAEYLNAGVFEAIWQDLDTWARGQIAASGEGPAGFLKRHAPLWHQVGRVCFHLAENRRDENRPFAFLATYAPRLTDAARVQYQPLGNALRQYAGAKDKKTLVKLLSPVHAASQQSSLVRDLVDSGDIYQPLAWTPREAYRFLKEVPIFENHGLLVRLPDWWKKRPRPRVGVAIGEKRKKKFGVGEMLDFQVQLALGDEEITEAELQKLLAGEEGLVLLRGQWVEVDRDKLTEALAHWKLVEQQAADGLSFIEGMRLLAGAPKDLDEEGEEGQEEREWSFVRAGKWLGEMLSGLRSPENLAKAAPGDSLKATLRPIRKSASTGFGSCRASGWARVWPTTWAWARQSKCSGCCWP